VVLFTAFFLSLAFSFSYRFSLSLSNIPSQSFYGNVENSAVSSLVKASLSSYFNEVLNIGFSYTRNGFNISIYSPRNLYIKDLSPSSNIV
jgi:hypothetical protein